MFKMSFSDSTKTIFNKDLFKSGNEILTQMAFNNPAECLFITRLVDGNF